MKKFNDKLREVRKLKGLTQRDIYSKMNVSPNCYASWEQGRTEPGIRNIRQLCEIFQVSADCLLDMENEEDGSAQQESSDRKE